MHPIHTGTNVKHASKTIPETTVPTAPPSSWKPTTIPLTVPKSRLPNARDTTMGGATVPMQVPNP